MIDTAKVLYKETVDEIVWTVQEKLWSILPSNKTVSSDYKQTLDVVIQNSLEQFLHITNRKHYDKVLESCLMILNKELKPQKSVSDENNIDKKVKELENNNLASDLLTIKRDVHGAYSINAMTWLLITELVNDAIDWTQFYFKKTISCIKLGISMIALKLARFFNAGLKERDSLVDIIGYSALVREAYDEEETELVSISNIEQVLYHTNKKN